MQQSREIAGVELADRDSRFRLTVLAWSDDDPLEARLLVSVEIESPGGSWRSRATSIMSPGVEEVASAAASAGRGHSGDGAIDYAAEGAGTALAFSFRFLPDEDCVVATVVVDGGLVPDIPQRAPGRSDTVLLRLQPTEVVAFAEALEQIAAREPGHVLWAG